MNDIGQTLSQLSHDYLGLHTKKEDLFWIMKMGLWEDQSKAHQSFAQAEIELKRFLQDPERLQQLRDLSDSTPNTDTRKATLAGWIAMLAAHCIESKEGRILSEELVHQEAELQHARGSMKLGYTHPDSGVFLPASSVELNLLIRTNPDERIRKAAYEGIQSIERFVLENGYLQVVKTRNRLARLLGYQDYYDWRVNVVEQMTKKQLFNILDDLERRTKQRASDEVSAFGKIHGEASFLPWNSVYLRVGSLTKELDPYFLFHDSLRRWIDSFLGLHIGFRGATLTLDLLDRKGKFENGFMHGPDPAFFDQGVWKSARINFSANAVAGALGSGLSAIRTLFHEGGHAAHFSNILCDAPCFSQEFAPTSIGYAETQSMFVESILEDPDWRARYAFDSHGAPMSEDLVYRHMRETQARRAIDVRTMLTVPFAERMIYELPDNELTADRVLSQCRAIEQTLQFLPSGIRPVMSVPHLLSAEASAYYHGYVLADIAVHQTRKHFLTRDGFITNNPRVGRDLAEGYWAKGNSVPFDSLVKSLTGSPLSADALVERCNQLPEQTAQQARQQFAEFLANPAKNAYEKAKGLDAVVSVKHGNQEIARFERPEEIPAACEAFSVWIQTMSKNTNKT